MATTDIVKKPAAQLEAAKRMILDQTSPEEVDSAAYQRSILERIAAAESFEAAFGAQSGLLSWGDQYEQVPVIVRDFALNPSKFEGQGVYAIVDLVLADGEVVRCTTGSRNVMMQLVALFEKGWNDKPVKLVGVETAAGFIVYRLEAA